MQENSQLDNADLEALANDPERRAKWAKENIGHFAKLLMENGMSAENAAALIERTKTTSETKPSSKRLPRRRPKFSELREAVPTQMTDAEYANVLVGKTRDGSLP